MLGIITTGLTPWTYMTKAVGFPLDPGDLKDYLDPHVIEALKREIAYFARRDPKRLTDEAGLRYIYSSVLEDHKVACPHPWRTYFAYMYQCRMCRSIFVPCDPV
jgi:hypothetical protein